MSNLDPLGKLNFNDLVSIPKRSQFEIPSPPPPPKSDAMRLVEEVRVSSLLRRRKLNDGEKVVWLLMLPGGDQVEVIRIGTFGTNMVRFLVDEGTGEVPPVGAVDWGTLILMHISSVHLHLTTYAPASASDSDQPKKRIGFDPTPLGSQASEATPVSPEIPPSEV